MRRQPLMVALVMVCATSAFGVVRQADSGRGMLDTVRPSVRGVLARSWCKVDVGMEPLLAPGATSPQNYTVSGPGQGTLAAHPNSVGVVNGPIYRLTWFPGEMATGQPLTITVAATLRDAAGNVMGWPYPGTTLGVARPAPLALADSGAGPLDTVPTTGTLHIEGDATPGYTYTTGVTLTLSASDSGSGVAQMQFSNEGSGWSA